MKVSESFLNDILIDLQNCSDFIDDLDTENQYKESDEMEAVHSDMDKLRDLLDREQL